MAQYFSLIKNINNFDYIIIAITLASFGLFTGILLAALITLGHNRTPDKYYQQNIILYFWYILQTQHASS